MKNKNELDKIFDFENVQEEDIIKKAKRKSYTKIISISLGISVLVSVLGFAAKLQLTPYVMNRKMAAIESYYSITSANTFLGPWDEENNIFYSGATSVKYKILGNKPVYTGEVDTNKINFNNELLTSNKNIYSYYGNKIMQFYHPFVQYDKTSNDLSYIDNIDSNKNIEMAISFDKQYTLKEIQDILPKDVNINWLWVDTFKDDSLEGLKKIDNGISKMDAQVLTENQVVGFSNIEKNGDIKENPIEDFIQNIKLGLSDGGKYKKEITYIYESLLNNSEDIDENNIKIIGAVVVGDKEKLNKLKDINIIKSSSFGVVSDKY